MVLYIKENKKIKKRHTTMSIRNCLFSPTLGIPQEFPTWCVPAKLSAIPHNYSWVGQRPARTGRVHRRAAARDRRRGVAG